jgi:hypothetical protein
VTTVYISIGNSDDKLTQSDWAAYYSNTAVAIQRAATTLHGQWVSEPASAWQNACWCVEINKDSAELLKLRLAEIAHDYRQESVAWAVAETEFITTGGATS